MTKSKAKILLLGKLPPPYIGPAIATDILLKSGLSTHYELIHLNTKLSGSIASFGKAELGKFTRSMALYVKLFFLIIRHQPDLVIIPNSQTTMGFLKDSLFILIAAITFRKVLLHLRGSNFLNWINSASFMTKRYVSFFLNRTDGVIVLGEKLRYLFEDYYQADQIHTVPNGGNYSFPTRTKSSEKIQLLYLANLLPSKGIKDILEAILLLKEQGGPSFEMHAAGSWLSVEFEKECTDFCSKHELPIVFHPPVTREEKLQLLADADIFLFTPNEPEGHPWVVVEALAAGLPIISTDQGAITESVLHEQNGYIVPTNSPKEIVKRMKQLMEDTELRKGMGAKSKSHYSTHFTETVMVKNLRNAIDITLR